MLSSRVFFFLFCLVPNCKKENLLSLSLGKKSCFLSPLFFFANFLVFFMKSFLALFGFDVLLLRVLSFFLSWFRSVSFLLFPLLLHCVSRSTVLRLATISHSVSESTAPFHDRILIFAHHLLQFACNLSQEFIRLVH